MNLHEPVEPLVASAQPCDPPRLSSVIHAIAAEAEGPITVARIRDLLGDRGVPTMLAVFAAINLLPLPPGTTLVLGIPLVILSIQLLLGHDRVWLPRYFLRRSIDARRLHDLAIRHERRLVRLERWVRPRYWPFARRDADRILGSVTLLLAIIVTVPIPLGNWLPAFATFLIALALSERDGILLAIGLLIGAASLLVVSAVVGTAGALASMLF